MLKSSLCTIVASFIADHISRFVLARWFTSFFISGINVLAAQQTFSDDAVLSLRSRLVMMISDKFWVKVNERQTFGGKHL